MSQPSRSAPYDMRCPVARTLDIIGERWTILILRDLLLEGPRKFQDLEDSLGGIARRIPADAEGPRARTGLESAPGVGPHSYASAALSGVG
jgi:hypothetical protein